LKAVFGKISNSGNKYGSDSPMMLLNTPPEPDDQALIDYYRRCATEGAVFHGAIGNQSYGLSDSFDPAWSVAAVCWCAGGTENYEFPGRETIRLKAGAVLAIGEYERYAYSAESEQPFMSSMIVFPKAMTRSLNRGVLDDNESVTQESAITTGLFKPGRRLMARMSWLANVSGSTTVSSESIEEQATLVAAGLGAARDRDCQRPDRLDSVKKTTREELCKRLKRAVAMMHDAYGDSSLDLAALAREACIARHHFVRVFAAAYGITPLRYLGEVRMEAAARLLESMDISASEAAKAVGFSNRSAFQRRFHQYFGVTPAAWRREKFCS
jgi:AraC-like DNA-binding protein